MLYFECPSCKANCETTEAFAGKAVHCPHCGKQVTVPLDPAAISATPLPPKAKPSSAQTGVTTTAAPTGQQPAATSAAAPAGGGTGLRNLVLVVVGVAIVVFIVIWMLPGDTGGGAGNGTQVVMETSMGTIKIELFDDKSPITVANFLRYVDDKHYDGTIFHRVMKDFMIQGGGFGPGQIPKGSKFAPIRNEASNGVSNTRGTLAMARTNDPNSATDQFFINVVDNTSKLDPGGVSPAGYAVFGKVIAGMDVVDTIRDVRVVRNEGGEMATPVPDVLIKSIRRAESSQKKK
jgi:peptidyl-prolyl cis-trans isomerase B (cyclophilin B)